VLIVALFGRELFAYNSRFLIDEKDEYEYMPTDLRDGEPKYINYETFGSAYMAALFIFYNEEWFISMQYLSKYSSPISIAFHILVIVAG
jgi:hypothetical protein